MATYRRPKGSYTRPTADFFLSQMMIGGVFFRPADGFSGVVELYNNATDGSALHVYKLWVGNDAGGAYWVTRQAGTQGGTAVTSYPVVSQGAPQPGLINYASAGQVNWDTPAQFVMPAYIGGDNEAGSLDDYSAPGPICVLMPGDSLQVFSPSISGISAGICAVTFYWAALRDVG